MVARSHIPAFSGVHVVLLHGDNVSRKRSACAACKVVRCPPRCKVDLHALGGAGATRVSGRADFQVTRGHIYGVRMNLCDGRPGVSVSKKCSACAAGKIARFVVACKVDLDALACPGAAQLGGISEFEVTSSHLAGIHIELHAARPDISVTRPDLTVTGKCSAGAVSEDARFVVGCGVNLDAITGAGSA